VRLSLRSAVQASVLAFGAVAVMAGTASAQVTVGLPDTSQTTILTAVVAEQARVTFPSGVSFTVADVASSTASANASVNVSNIVLATASKQLKISLQANAAAFTAPVSGATTWSASDVTWGAGSWTNATGAAGTLSNSAYNEVATCAADAASCDTSSLVFTLGAKSTVQRSGNHTLVVRWRVESIGS
jgi:hypothetical protein